MKKHALFIGIDHYKDPTITPLRCAARDARELAALFKHQLKFETTVLTHDELNAGRSINSELWRIKKALEPGSVFVLYFAGHGKTANGPEGKDQLLLLPLVDGSLLDRGNFVGEGVLSYRSLCAQTDTWEGVHRAFIFDACRIPIKRAEAESRDTSNLVQFEGEVVYRGLAFGPKQVTVAAASLVTLNSCHDKQRAEELPNYQSGHGLFTAALLEILRDYETKQQSVVLDDELTLALATRMHQLARTHAQRDTIQRPLRVGAPVCLYEAMGTTVADLVASFERQIAAGQLDKPVGDNCTATLHLLSSYAQNHAQIHTLNARLQHALDERELTAKHQRDQKKFDVACQLDTAIAYGNYLATCELGEHTAQAQAAMLVKKQQEQGGPQEVVTPKPLPTEDAIGNGSNIVTSPPVINPNPARRIIPPSKQEVSPVSESQKPQISQRTGTDENNMKPVSPAAHEQNSHHSGSLYTIKPELVTPPAISRRKTIFNVCRAGLTKVSDFLPDWLKFVVFFPIAWIAMMGFIALPVSQGFSIFPFFWGRHGGIHEGNILVILVMIAGGLGMLFLNSSFGLLLVVGRSILYAVGFAMVSAFTLGWYDIIARYLYPSLYEKFLFIPVSAATQMKKIEASAKENPKTKLTRDLACSGSSGNACYFTVNSHVDGYLTLVMIYENAMIPRFFYVNTPVSAGITLSLPNEAIPMEEIRLIGQVQVVALITPNRRQWQDFGWNSRYQADPTVTVSNSEYLWFTRETAAQSAKAGK